MLKALRLASIIVIIFGIFTLTNEGMDWLFGNVAQAKDLPIIMTATNSSPLSNGGASFDHLTDNTSLAGPTNDWKNVTILCLVPVHGDSYNYVHIQRTWGRRCDKLVFYNTQDGDDFLQGQYESNVRTVKLNVKEGRKNLWLKVRMAFQHVYENHLSDADWFLKADDDTYVIIENLKYLLMDFDPDSRVYFGRKIWDDVKYDVAYTSGGSGYVLSRAALKALVEGQPTRRDMRHGDITRRCNWNEKGLDIRAEDVNIGICLKEVGITPITPPKSTNINWFLWMAKASQNSSLGREDNPDPWFEIKDMFKSNFICCSQLPISFHSVKASDMYLIEYFTRFVPLLESEEDEERFKIASEQ